MPKLLFILFLFNFTISCKNQKREINPVLPPVTRTITIIDFIANDGEVHSGATGYGGGKSDQFKRYEWMKSKLSDSTLHQLTDHQSPAVRVYAFFALAERNSPLLSEIAIKHKNDSASFNSRCGCLGMTDQINKCFRRVVDERNWFASWDDLGNPSKKNRN